MGFFNTTYFCVRSVTNLITNIVMPPAISILKDVNAEQLIGITLFNVCLYVCQSSHTLVIVLSALTIKATVGNMISSNT